MPQHPADTYFHARRAGVAAWRGERDRREREPRWEGKRMRSAAMRERAKRRALAHTSEGERREIKPKRGRLRAPPGKGAHKQGRKREPPLATEERPKQAADTYSSAHDFRRPSMASRKRHTAERRR